MLPKVAICSLGRTKNGPVNQTGYTLMSTKRLSLLPSFENHTGRNRVYSVFFAFLSRSQGLKPLFCLKTRQTLVECLNLQTGKFAQLPGERLGRQRLGARCPIHVYRHSDNCTGYIVLRKERAQSFKVAGEGIASQGRNRVSAQAIWPAHRDTDPFSAEVDGGNNHQVELINVYFSLVKIGRATNMI
jgi:hypothetical protein